MHNDMRHIRHLVIVANNGLKKSVGVERDIALHQYLFAVKLWCGTLNEAHDVVNSGWKGSGLAARLHENLAADAKNALSRFTKYFSRANLIRKIRREFAFHYDANAIAAELQNIRLDDGYEFFTSGRSGNIFYSSAEGFRNLAFLKAIGFADKSSAIGDLYDEINKVHDQFMIFSHAVMVAIVKKSGVQWQEATATSVVDPGSVEPIIFVDEQAMISTLKQRGIP